MNLTFQSKRLKLLGFLLLFSVVAVSGCGKKSGPEGNGKNEVIWWQLSDIQGLNPITTSDESAYHVQNEIFETLVSNNPRTLDYIPCLASLPEISADHLTYTFTMDPRAKFSDGQPVTSADVIFTYKAILNPLMINNKPLRGILIYFDSVYCPNGDVSKVAFHLSKPNFKAIDDCGSNKILPKHLLDPKNLTDKISWADLHDDATKNPAVQEFATWFESPEISRDPKRMIGSGPYTFVGWVTNDHLVLKRNPNYWAMEIPWSEAYPETLNLRTINDQNAALVALKAGDIDIEDGLKPEQFLNQLDTVAKPFLAKTYVYQNVYTFVCWNNRKPLFQDKMVRKALTMLIDRDLILHSISHDLGRKCDGPIAPTQPNWDSTVKEPGYNPDSAKKLLAAAGWTDSDGDGILDKVINGKRTPFSFTFLVNSGNETRKQTLLIIAEALRKVGIDANIQAIEWSIYLQRTKDHQYDACYGAWIGNVTEDDIAQLWSTPQIDGGSNYYCYSNPKADQLMNDIKVEFDKTKRYQMHYALQRMIVDDQPVSWLFNSPTMIGWNKRFENVEFFRTRPPFDPRYWIPKGFGIKRTANGIVMSTPNG